MAAGQGFKTFTTGEVLTAGDVNGYLMQGINVFTNATARDAAITAPAEGQFAFTKDNNSLWYYDGAAWVASGATGDIEGVTATSPLTGGGTSGTVTVGIQSASTSQLGAVQLSDSIASTSTTLAATANAVKTAYDLANSATGPAFYAYLSANQTVSTGVVTKLQINTEEYDLGSCYDNATNYRFTPNKAGIYQINSLIQANGSSGTTIWIYKNGATIREGSRTAGAGSPMGFSTQVTMNGSTDYIEFFAQVAAGTIVYGGQSTTGFGAAYLRSN